MKVLARSGNFLRQRQRWVLVALLAVLHLTLLAGVASTIGRMFWLVDVGLFILWQPFIQAERRLDAASALLLTVLLGLGLWLFGNWLLVLWVLLLSSLLGGRVMMLGHRPTRIFYLLAFGYLVAVLLVWLVPRVVPPGALVGPSLDPLLAWGLPVVLVVMLLLPRSQDYPVARGGMVDFFYSIFIFLLMAVLVLGSLAFMLLRQALYIEAVFNTLVSMALVLFLIAWAWNPRPGFSGLGVFFSRYLMTLALPFDVWLQRLMEAAEQERDPDRFMASACAGLLELPWVIGGVWAPAAGESAGNGTFGESSSFRQDFPLRPLLLTLYTRHALSPSLIWHFRLLTQLINEYYLDKQRARELEKMGYLRAVHETGARLTHDMKNLLQSLSNLCFAVQSADPAEVAKFHVVLRRQLPQITLRLQQTLEKLQAPREAQTASLLTEAERAPGPWWMALKQRHANDAVVFEPTAPKAGLRIPLALYDSVAENLLQNALAKRQQEDAVSIRVFLSDDASVLQVCDDGSPVPSEQLKDLLSAPVTSENGLGIGLYQAARQAERYGYTLRLASNVPGAVCFELRRNTPEKAADSPLS